MKYKYRGGGVNKAVFLDRDGTINVEKGYLYRQEEFEFLPRVLDGLKLLQSVGYILIIITNQSGIARGYYTEEDYKCLNQWMLDELRNSGIYIADIYYCPHHPKANVAKYRLDCSCRKPALGMFMKAVSDFDIDLGKSFTIGDKIRDTAICESTECKGYLIGENENREVIDLVKQGKYRNVEYKHDLFDCAMEIVAGRNRK